MPFDSPQHFVTGKTFVERRKTHERHERLE